MPVTLREPSAMRAVCTIASSAALICWRIALTGMSNPESCIIISRRLSESRAEFACTVEIEPSWPVFMACSMSRHSEPRTCRR
jgi:hypothetical protein